MRRTLLAIAVVLASLGLLPGQAHAIPKLQLYIEGSTYDPDSESWLLEVPAGSSFRVWAIANVQATEPSGILDVRMAISYAETPEPVVISLTPSRAGGLDVGQYDGIADPSAPTDTGTRIALPKTSTNPAGNPDGPVVVDGSRPLDGEGKPITGSGLYGAGTYWQEFSLGDFTKRETTIRNFEPGDSTPGGTWGQINVYDVAIAAPTGMTFRFDLYDHYIATIGGRARTRPRIHTVEVPGSHDARATGGDVVPPVPEPSTLAMALAGLIPLGVLGLRRLRRRAEAASS